MGQELQLPDSFKNRQMAPAFQTKLNAQEDNLAEGIGQSYGVIAYKGKVWSLRYRGERKTVIRPDDGTPSAYLDVIILGQAHGKSKSFYKKYDAATSDGDRPICSSIDGVIPDMDVTTKQSESCALCPRNVWKTDPATGRKGRECTDYKRLAVLVLPTQTQVLFGQPLLEPVFLRVPPDSLNSLAIMGETMAAQGYHYSSYITRITFDPQKAHPCMQFRPLQGLTDQEAPVILELRDSPIVGRITGGDIAQLGMKAVTQAIITPSEVEGSANVPLIQVPGPALGQTLGQAPTPPVVQQTVPLATGLGLGAAAAPVNPPQQGPQPGLQTAADVGVTEASDDELDARIASLVAR